MAENSSLAYDYDWLMKAVGNYLGFGTTVDPDDYSAGQKYQADDVSIQGGLSKFYAPEPMGKMPPVQWSFLYPVASLSIKTGVDDYDLSDDCNAVIGTVSILTTTGCYGVLKNTNEGRIRAFRSVASSVTGIPEYVATRWKPINTGFGQRMEMLIYPKPTTTYTLQFKQRVTPRRLSKTNRFPYGGMQHAQTILQACLSEAESKVQDIVNGPQTIAYMARLAASIAADASAGRGEQLGYCGDPSTPECYRLNQSGVWTDSTQTTYNGASQF